MNQSINLYLCQAVPIKHKETTENKGER